MLCQKLVLSLGFALGFVLCTPGYAGEQKKEDSKQQGVFTRLTRDKDDALKALEVAIVRFAPTDCGQAGPIVDLISAIHVADGSYYDELNQRFTEYDAVLYELVAPEGAKIPKAGPGRPTSPISFLQTGMTGVLELEFQLEGVDYTAENLVHADMSPEEFAESMKERGESFFQMFFRMMGYSMSKAGRQAAGPSELELVRALFSKDRAMALKRLLAEQMQDMEGATAAINGPDGSTIITGRNKVALDVLREQLDAGKQKLAIFYGAGHMPDFQQRLGDDFLMTRLSTEWLVAWDLADEKQDASEKKAKRKKNRNKAKAADVP